MTGRERITVFCTELWAWFKINKRTLPWRDLPDDDLTDKAYKVLVSEIMLQQTQVPRVIILYKKFIQTFPSIQKLSKATNRQVLIAWKGLGYNSRALRIRDAARVIVDQFDGQFPSSMEDLQSIKGIGHYTAAAIRNFAFNLPTPCIDTNIRRILHRFFVGSENADGMWKKNDEYLLRIAGEVLEVAMLTRGGMESKERKERKESKERKIGDTEQSLSVPSLLSLHSVPAADFHAALMDFGSLVCTKTNPRWDLFSAELRSICKAYGKTVKLKKTPALKEPGRLVAGTFIPNRIFRGRIVEFLRSRPKGAAVHEIGRVIAEDWQPEIHAEWIQSVLNKLTSEMLIEVSGRKYLLAE